MHSKMIYSILLLLGGIWAPLFGEIQMVTFNWNAALCLDVCTPKLERELGSIKAITDLQINPQAGVAKMKWDPNYPFNFAPFNLATRSVGIRLNQIRVRVRGTIAHDVDNLYVISLGDGTRFQIAGPIQPITTGYTIRENIASHPVPLAMRERLLEAEANREITTIEGPLFEPFRYNLTIVAEQVRYPKPEPVPQRNLRPTGYYR